MTDKVIIRPATLKDRAYIFNSWLHNQYWSSLYFQRIEQDTYFKEYSRHITRLLESSQARIDVATLESDETLILGYLVYSGPIAHWCYVKRDYRGKGILNLMLQGKTLTHYTGSTLPGHEIAKSLKLLFNPFLT
jgi:hypothetical protein